MGTLPSDSIISSKNVNTQLPEGPDLSASKIQFQDIINKIKTNVGNSGENVGSFLASADKSEDGKLDSQELATALDIPEQLSREFITAFDSKDGDGVLDEAELTNALEEDVPPPFVSHAEGDRYSDTQMDLLEMLLKLLDKDGDGKVSREEFRDFAFSYGNGNNKITTEEFAYGLMTEAKAQGLDFTSEDIQAIVEAIDADGDGFIRHSEIESLLNEVELQAETSPVPHEPETEEIVPDEPEPETEADEQPDPVEVGPDVLPWQALINLVDKNGDGKVSKSELTDFELEYGTGDGWLTKDELKAGLRAEAEAHGLSVTDEDIDKAADMVDADENKILTAAELTVPLNEQSLLNNTLTQ